MQDDGLRQGKDNQRPTEGHPTSGHPTGHPSGHPMGSGPPMAPEELLKGAIETLQEGFALFDADDRLVISNQKFRRLHPAPDDLLKPGVRFEDLFRNVVENGKIIGVKGREEQVIQERLEQHRNPQGPVIREMTNGAHYIINEGHTPDGGTCLTMTDISDLKRVEKKLRDSEALFRGVVDNSPTKIHIKDTQGRYILINPEAEKLFGITDAEGRGRTSHDLFSKDVADSFVAHDQEVISLGRTTEKEEDFEFEGGIRTYLTVKFPIYNSDGIAAVAAIGTDITERKRSEKVASQLVAALESLSENFALWGPDDRMIMCNRKFQDINASIPEFTKPGTLFEDHVRKLVENGLVEKAIGREEEWLQERLERHRNPSGAFEMTRQDGSWFLVREQRMADGATATIATNITERKHAEEALRRAHDDLEIGIMERTQQLQEEIEERKRIEEDLIKAKEMAELANRAKSELLANMSHELRTPLNAIIGFSDTIIHQIFGPLGNHRYAEYMNNINESGKHLLELISDILDVSVIEAGKLELLEEDLNLADLAEACVLLVRSRAEKEGVQLTNNIGCDLPHLFADERRIKQVFINLLTNAIKFTLRRGKVDLDAGVDDDGWFRITVSDTGIGMDEEGKKRAFLPFNQTDSMIARTAEGYGLGLPLTKGLVENHGGDISIDSEPGAGTRVTVRFPPERVHRLS